MRVMMRMLATTYGLSVISTPTFEIARAERAHDVGDDVHGPAAHRAVEQRADLPLRLGRLHPVVGRTGVVLLRVQMKVRCSVRATSDGSERCR